MSPGLYHYPSGDDESNHESKHKTSDGFDVTWGTNHLGPFLLTELLTPLLLRTAKEGKEKGERPRVINVSSVAHRMFPLEFDRLDFDGRSQKDCL